MTGQIIQAILLGGYYALTAAGLTFMLQVMRVINLAHGSLAIVFAYAVFVLAANFGIHPFLGLALILPVAAVVGWALQRLLLERAARGGELLPILSTFGLAIVLDNVMFQIFGANARSLSQFVGDLAFAAYELPGGIFVGKLPVWILIAAIVVLGGLHLILTRTAMGRRIRATAIDPVTAGLVGVDARQNAAIAAAIAMMMVAMSGVALGFRTVFDAYAGGPQLLFAFEATIIGGARSMWGVFIGAMVLAFAQTIAAMIHPQAFLLGGHIAFLVVLFARLAIGSGTMSARLRQMIGGA